MKIGILLSVREKSSRLPGKVLKKIIDKNVTEHLISRLKMADYVDNIWILKKPRTSMGTGGMPSGSGQDS